MILRKYGVSATVKFPLITRDAPDLKAGATFAAGDVKIIKDEGASANTTNLPADEGNGDYSLVITATEMQAARVSIMIADQTSPKVFEDQYLAIDSYGNASAQHEFDLDDANPDANVVSMAAGVITAAAIATGAVDADALATDAVTEIADGLLQRAISNVEPGAAFRTLYGAIASLVNKREISGTNIVLYKSDDSTILATIPITTDATLDPIKSIDPP